MLLLCCLALSTALPRVEFPLLPTKAALTANFSNLARRESWEDAVSLHPFFRLFAQ